MGRGRIETGHEVSKPVPKALNGAPQSGGIGMPPQSNGNLERCTSNLHEVSKPKGPMSGAGNAMGSIASMPRSGWHAHQPFYGESDDVAFDIRVKSEKTSSLFDCFDSCCGAFEDCGVIGKFCCDTRMLTFWMAVIACMVMFIIGFYVSLGLAAPEWTVLGWEITEQPDPDGNGAYVFEVLIDLYNPTRLDLHFRSIEGELMYDDLQAATFHIAEKSGRHVPAGGTGVFKVTGRSLRMETLSLIKQGHLAAGMWAAQANNEDAVFDVNVAMKDGWVRDPLMGVNFTFYMDFICHLRIDLQRNLKLMLLASCPTGNGEGQVKWGADQSMCLSSAQLNPNGSLPWQVYGNKTDYSLVVQSCQDKIAKTFKWHWDDPDRKAYNTIQHYVAFSANGSRQPNAPGVTMGERCVDARAGRGGPVVLSKCDRYVYSEKMWSNETKYYGDGNTINLAAGWDSSELDVSCLEVDEAAHMEHVSSSYMKRIQLAKCDASKYQSSQIFKVPWKLCVRGSEWWAGMSEGSRKQAEEGGSMCGDFSYGGTLYEFLFAYIFILVFASVAGLCICCFRGKSYATAGGLRSVARRFR